MMHNIIAMLGIRGSKTQRTGDVNASTNDEIYEHKLSREELEAAVDSNFTAGLTSKEAAARLLSDGHNILTPPYKTPILLQFLSQLVGGFALLLWAGSILCFAVYGVNGSIENLVLGIVLAGVVILTGSFSFYQELRSEQVQLSITATDSTRITVLHRQYDFYFPMYIIEYQVLQGFLKLTPATCDVLRDAALK